MIVLKNFFKAFFVVFIIGELSLRFLGFCNAPLFFSDMSFEYLALPNQSGYRFGNKYSYNEFSQRSSKISKKKKKILGVGDSIINGGVPTDQNDLATTIVSESTSYQVLNISAGSWGPDNVAAYIEKYGTFGAEQMILVCSSHDSHDNMDFQKIVGVHPSYPNKQYNFAWHELFDRYLFEQLFKKSYQGDHNVIKNGLNFNKGFDQLLNVARKRNLSFVIYLHPELSELNSNKYTKQGLEIIDWANRKGVKLVRGLNQGLNASNYRDNIHLNKFGQRELARIFIDSLILQ
jgi:hypothetical protein